VLTRRPWHTPLRSASAYSPSITRLTGILQLPNSPSGFAPPPLTSLAHTRPSLSRSRTLTGRLLLALLLPSGFTFSVRRPPSRDGSKSLASVVKASRVKGPAVPRPHLWVQLPLLPIMLSPHPHVANLPPPRKALASESVPKGNRSAVHCLSSARSPRSSSPNRVVSHSRLPSPLSPPIVPGQFSSTPFL